MTCGPKCLRFARQQSRDSVSVNLIKFNLSRFVQIYYTGKGYGVVTPDTYRKTSVVENAEKSLLLSNEEALARAHGTVETYPHGNVVDKAIQTNLVDVICRGNFSFN